ncbi:ATP-dependent nuclease [Niallia endozanthoxylica]|uniref:AAA family ATPase n=1 Tax=Niallia endozanthoxylica TaxID=2036016 RepID=A0A5J5GXZ5_9BACI|nr:AAA family ATPase [Niallia endozanthoxylica]KAA9012284.1 AAA family ATPase [Niallia endozanthoxylica]
MRLNYIEMKNYRNFIDTKLRFDEKTLIIGANDIGKTNVLYALQLLLDKSLSENDLQPLDEDFCIYSAAEANEFSITLHFVEANEECILSCFREYISDNDDVYIRYVATRTRIGGTKEYKLFVGPSLEELQLVSSRFYLRALNMRYVSATRQIDQYLKNQKNRLIEYLQDARTDEEEQSDNEKFQDLSGRIKVIESELNTLSFIGRAGETLNNQLRELSEHHQEQKLKLGVDLPANDDLFRKFSLLSSIGEHNIQLGGEGRKNQAFIALWSALNQISIQDGQPNEVSIFCIEECEAHLHPHQQRKLAEYLVNVLPTQVILTSHSPYIACEFNPSSIIRLHTKQGSPATICNQNGVSEELGNQIRSMEYRLSPLIAEVYFSDCVLLVEGTSEIVFYKNLAHQLGVDLDKLNISVLSVEGVGFTRYIDLLNALGIPWVMRTDNDYQKYNRPKQQLKEAYYLTGIRRLTNIFSTKCSAKVPIGEQRVNLAELIAENADRLTENPTASNAHRQEMYNLFYLPLSNYGLFLAKEGLEEDIYHSNDDLTKAINQYFVPNEEDEEVLVVEDMVAEMKSKKSTFMYHFLEDNSECLNSLEDDPLAGPLYACQTIVQQLRIGHHGEL